METVGRRERACLGNVESWSSPSLLLRHGDCHTWLCTDSHFLACPCYKLYASSWGTSEEKGTVLAWRRRNTYPRDYSTKAVWSQRLVRGSRTRGREGPGELTGEGLFTYTGGKAQPSCTMNGDSSAGKQGQWDMSKGWHNGRNGERGVVKSGVWCGQVGDEAAEPDRAQVLLGQLSQCQRH